MSRKRQPPLFAYGVEFTEHRREGIHYNGLPRDPVIVNVMATGVEQARNVAARETLTQFIAQIPKHSTNICWSKDYKYEGCGFISVQYPRGARLSPPYHMTKRMKVEVTLGNIPIQMSFNFGD